MYMTKKVRLIFVIGSVLLFVLMGYTSQETENKAKEYDIKIEAPVVMSSNEVKLSDGSTAYVNIEMTKGRYFFDYMGGGLYGANWCGLYQVRTYTDKYDYLESTLYSSPINVWGDEMNFGGVFQLVFDDYNGDGNPDFALGQWGGSNGNFFKIFTVCADGEVKELESDGPMIIGSHEFSIKLDKIAPASFSKKYYFNGNGETITTIYEWDGNKFIAK